MVASSAFNPCSKSIILLYSYLLLFASNGINSVIGAKVRYYKFEVEYIHWSSDCVDNIVIGINGQFPGPTIRAEVGDTVHVDLINKFDMEGVVIHWHGIKQVSKTFFSSPSSFLVLNFTPEFFNQNIAAIMPDQAQDDCCSVSYSDTYCYNFFLLQFGTPWADGTASISQCAINPGESFTYRFIVSKAGTYFYHAHYGLQRSAGLYGSLIVEVGEGEKEPFHYDEEFSLLFSDWWHEDSHQQAVDLSSKPFRWIGEPQSLLMNGRGQFNCSLAAGNCTTHSQCTPQILNVQPNKTYRLRLASSTSLASLNFAIGGHKLVVVEADGNYVQPFGVDNMDVYSGESYSILFTTNQDPNNNYWISISVRGRLPKTPQGLSILNYSPNSPSKLPISPPPISPLWNDFNYSKEFSNKILALMGSPKPPINYDRRISFLNTQNLIDGYTKWTINNVSLSLPATPYLGSIRYGLKNAFDTNTPPQELPMDYDIMKPPINPNSTYGNRVYMLNFNTTIDVILQNANALNPNVSEIHPWHLHGHDFWILAYGEGKFKEEEDEKKFNLKNPPLRNTAVIFPYGWTALRFVADNPGVWAFHCHIEPHLHMGMGVVFAEGVRRLKKVPKEAIGCGLSGKMLMTNNHG